MGNILYGRYECRTCQCSHYGRFPGGRYQSYYKGFGARLCLIDPSVRKRAEFDALEKTGLISLEDFSVLQLPRIPFNREEVSSFC